jgi:dipeptidyl aminopeptidase/acylaminoacyl peptidase
MGDCRPSWSWGVLTLLLACSGGGPAGPDTGGDPAGPDTGSIEVTSLTTGESPDPDGYVLTVDGHERPISANATIVFGDLAPGDHGLAIGGLATNCTLGGAPTRTVPVAAGAATRVHLDVSCPSLSRSLEITTATTGAPADPDGYGIVLDGAAPRPIGLNETVTVDDIAPGSHTLWLQGVAPNCRASDNPRDVTVTAGGAEEARYEIVCAAATDAGVMLFASDRSGASHLYRMRDDGRNIVDLTPSDESFGGDWSPDGGHIVFQLFEGNRPVLYLMNGDGSARTPLHASGGGSTWSPDGRRIAFSNGDVQVMNADGAEAVDLGPGSAPDWSPDGSRIAFHLEEREQCFAVADLQFCPSALYVMQPDGSGRRKLLASVDPSDQLTSPAWSPDGTRIAFMRQCCFFGPKMSGLWVLSLAGDSPRRIYPGRVLGKPVWSPDGSRIAFGAVDLSEDSDLLVIPSDGSDTTVLVSSHGSEYPTSWK